MEEQERTGFPTTEPPPTRDWLPEEDELSPADVGEDQGELTEPVESPFVDPRKVAYRQYGEAGDKLDEVDAEVATLKAGLDQAKEEQKKLLHEIAAHCKVLGSDPLGKLKGRGVPWRPRKAKESTET